MAAFKLAADFIEDDRSIEMVQSNVKKFEAFSPWVEK